MPKRLGLCPDIPGSFKSIWVNTNKVGCVFMIIISLMLHAEFGPNSHREDTSHFTFKSCRSVNLTSDHTIVHNVYVDYDNQSTHSKLHRPSFICNDVINDVIKRREIRRPPERKELSPQVLKHRQRWLARINRIHRPFLTDRRPLR